MGTQGTGRKRSTKKDRSTAEDDALNLIAREAEARLAAKRAARAEAREIRMKELERQQKEIFQVQKKYYGLNPKVDDRADGKWGDIEQWMEDSERYSRSSRIQTLSDEDERMSVGSRGSVRSDLDTVGAYGGGGSSLHKKSKKKKKHKHKDRDGNGHDDDYSVVSGRSSRLSDESRVSRSSRLDLTSSRLSDDSRLSRASKLDLQPTSYASSNLYSLNGLSSSRNPGSAFNGYQFYRSLSQITQQIYRRPLDYSSYRSSGSRASSRASSARASPVDNCGSVASFLRSAAGSGGLPRDLDDVTIPDFSDVEDRDYLEKGSRAASALTAATLTSLGGSSSRRGSGETALTVDAESSIREIKDALAQSEEKYRKAMVSNAQLDNEKNNLMYQVDTLKDSLMELEELLSESRREFEEKAKDYEREKHAHGVLQFQFNDMKETLKQSEELLNKHGIVLGPDLNVNGDSGEAGSDASPTADAAAQEPLSSPTEGNSMLGNTEETEFRSSRKEDVDPQQHQKILEESKENLLNCDERCDGADESPLETSNEKPPPNTPSPSMGEDDTCKDLMIEPIIENKAVTVSSSELRGDVVESEKSLTETVTSEEGLNKTRYPDREEAEIKSSAETHGHDNTETSDNFSEKQDRKCENTEETDLISTETCHQQTVACVTKETPIHESVTALSNTESQQEPEIADEVDKDVAEESASNSNKSKKKKKKKRAKKKGATHNDTQNQQSSGAEKESVKTVKQVESGETKNGSIVQSHADILINEDFKESNMNPVENEQDIQQVGNAVPVEAPESDSQEKTVKETRTECDKKQKEEGIKTLEVKEAPETLVDTNVHNVTDEQKTEMKETHLVEAVQLTDSCPHVQTHKELRTNSRKNQKDDELGCETDKLEAVTSVDLEDSPCEHDINSKSGDSLNEDGTACADITDNTDLVPTNTNFISADSESVDQMKDKSEEMTECTNNNRLEMSSEENTDLESLVSNGGDVSALETESMKISSLSTTDAFRKSSESEPSAATKSSIDPSVNVLDQNPRERTETVADDEMPTSASPCQDSDPEQEEAGREELDQSVTEPGVSDKPHSSSFDEESEASSATKQPAACDAETLVQSEQLQESEGETAQLLEPTDETVSELKREEDCSLDCHPEARQTEVGNSITQETAGGEDPEHENSQRDESEELQESVQARGHDFEQSLPTQVESDDEEDEDEGQSFDFDDLDVEAAIAPELPDNPEEEEFEEGVEATSDGGSDVKSEPSQIDSPPDGNTEQDKPAETTEETGSTDQLRPVVSEAADQEPQENSEKEETALQEEGEEEGKSELGAVVENIKQKMSSLVEEAFDVVKLDWQSDSPAPPKSPDPVAGHKGPPPAGRGARKGSKKGKGKEDCKVS